MSGPDSGTTPTIEDAGAVVAALYEAAIDGSWAVALGHLAEVTGASVVRLVVSRDGAWQVFASSDDLARYLPGDGIDRRLPEAHHNCRFVFDGVTQPRAAEMVRLSGLHLERVLDLARRLSQGRERDLAARAALDQLSVAVVVLDGRGRVVRVNRGAHSLLRPEIGIWIEGETLRATPERHFAVLSLIARLGAASRDRPGRAAEYLELSRQGRTPLRVLAVPMPGEGGPRAEQVYALFFGDPKLGIEAPEEVLARRFGLSPVEARAIELLLLGWGTDAIAASLEQSPESARELIGGIYKKVGTTRQGDLVAMVLSGSVAEGQVGVRSSG